MAHMPHLLHVGAHEREVDNCGLQPVEQALCEAQHHVAVAQQRPARGLGEGQGSRGYLRVQRAGWEPGSGGGCRPQGWQQAEAAAVALAGCPVIGTARAGCCSARAGGLGQHCTAKRAHLRPCTLHSPPHLTHALSPPPPHLYCSVGNILGFLNIYHSLSAATSSSPSTASSSSKACAASCSGRSRRSTPSSPYVLGAGEGGGGVRTCSSEVLLA